MLVHKIVNDYQHSCTYILYKEECDHVWLIDCGGYGTIEHWLNDNKKSLKGVFLTHCHDDHINGLKKLLHEEPDTPIYLSSHEGIRCVQDIRLNLTKFTSEPFQIFSEHFIELEDGEKVRLFEEEELVAIHADGHSPDSIVYKVGDKLFTGDAFIPPLAVVTKLPGGNKVRAAESLKMVLELVENENLTVLSGHSIKLE